jgi:hypothetical protein
MSEMLRDEQTCSVSIGRDGMGTSIVDGTLEEVTVRRTMSKFTTYKQLIFKLDDGSTRTINNAIAERAIAPVLAAGTHGRFYLFTSFDLKGVHGIRLPDGQAIYGFPGSNNKKIFLIVGLANLAWVLFRIATTGDLPLLGTGLTILGAVGYFLTDKAQRETKQHFDEDNGHLATPVPGSNNPAVH